MRYPGYRYYPNKRAYNERRHDQWAEFNRHEFWTPLALRQFKELTDKLGTVFARFDLNTKRYQLVWLKVIGVKTAWHANVNDAIAELHARAFPFPKEETYGEPQTVAQAA
jgi:hypothetical protein